MKINRIHCVFAAVFGTSVALAAQAASLDLGRLFDAGKSLTTAATPIDEKQEITIGRDVAGTVLGAAPLVDDPALQSYINKVGRWIASQGERPDLPWHFGVVETNGINAFAAPGGYILVTRGLYTALDNESQLAGVLGHEIAHVIKRHHITVMQKQAGTQGLVGLGSAAVGSRSAVGNAVNQQLSGLISDMLTKGLDKEAEYEADHLGVVLAARAGYGPNGLVEVLRKLQARAGEPSLKLLFTTHPHPRDRLDKLGELMAPRMGDLPAGTEPAIQAVSTSAPARGGAAAPMPSGVRGLAPEAEQAAAPSAGAAPSGGSGGGLDAGTLLRGLFGR